MVSNTSTQTCHPQEGLGGGRGSQGSCAFTSLRGAAHHTQRHSGHSARQVSCVGVPSWMTKGTQHCLGGGREAGLWQLPLSEWGPEGLNTLTCFFL